MLSTEAVLVLGGMALATSAFTATLGLGGGIILLSVLLLYFEPQIAIPVHAGVQLVSNASRTVLQRAHVRWRLVGRYALPLLPAGIPALWLLGVAPVAALRLAIALFILVATWVPRALLLGLRPERVPAERRFLLLGTGIGFLNVLLGATGPLQGPFFLGLGLSRQGIVGTFAACQTLGHLTKLVLFGAAGFAFREHLPMLGLLAALVIAGTWGGTRLLERVPERAFLWLYRGVLTAVALYIGAVQAVGLF